MITEESFIDFKCPCCKDSVSFPQETAGHLRECPICQESLVVPAAGQPAARPPIPIATPRLVLRRLAPGDWKDLLEVMSDEEMYRYIEMAPMDEERILRWLEQDTHVRITTPDQIFFLGIAPRESGKVAGYLGLSFIDSLRLQASFHLLVGRNHQRKGFGIEAVRALLGFCFNGIKLHRVTASCDARDAATCGLLEKAGMRREGESVKNKPLLEGGWVNTVYYAVLAEEFGVTPP
jgi:RimJ/RimL family protein N-acetyltransferase